jgi:hypothetical protein
MMGAVLRSTRPCDFHIHRAMIAGRKARNQPGNDGASQW